MTETAVQTLLNDPRIWRPGRRDDSARRRALGTGHPELDAALPDGGWPLGTVAEIFHDHPGVGELELICPTLAAVAERRQWLALIGPPYIPYAPGLVHAGIDPSRVLLIHPRAHEEHLWAAEQALQSGTCGAVGAWPQQADSAALRRLQLAAEAGDSWAVLFRPRSAAEQPSPAAIRLSVAARPDDTLDVHLHKCRGAQPRRLHLRTRRSAGGGASPAPATARPSGEVGTVPLREAPAETGTARRRGARQGGGTASSGSGAERQQPLPL